MNIIRKIFIFILAAAGTGGIGYLANLASGNPLFTQSFWGYWFLRRFYLCLTFYQDE